MNNPDLKIRVQEIFAQIMQRAPEHKIQPTLDRVLDALNIIGNPQFAYPIIHVTGTNGKTSTSRMIDSLMTAWGSKTGRFTSPHLHVPNERISFCGEAISDENFVYAYEDVEPYIKMADENSIAKGGPRLSFFEVLVVMAYAFYADAPVDVAIMEIGLGGTWDATNVADAAVSVITPISIDHTAWLGSTIEQIAIEKAGVIKPGQTVIVGKQPDEAKEILVSKANEVGASIFFYGEDLKVLSKQNAVGGQLLTLQTPLAVYEDIYLPLHGDYQAENAVCALAAVESFYASKSLAPEVVELGFANATSPGRLEVVRSSPTVIVDAAHNPEGANVLAKALDDVFPNAYLTGIFSAMKDKDVESILENMERVLAQIVLVQMDGDRSMKMEVLAKTAENIFGTDRVHIADNLSDAIQKATDLSDENSEFMANSAILSFGSVVLAGKIRELFKRN